MPEAAAGARDCWEPAMAAGTQLGPGEAAGLPCLGKDVVETQWIFLPGVRRSHVHRAQQACGVGRDEG